MSLPQLRSDGPLERRSGVDRRNSSKPQQRQGVERRVMRADGLLTHDAFSPPPRRAGLAILDCEEGESI